jgi:hypothetical protein
VKQDIFLSKPVKKMIGFKGKILRYVFNFELYNIEYLTLKQYICGGREKVGKSKMLIFQGNDSKFHIIPKIL